MTAAIILEYDCDAIRAAQSVALLKFNNAHPELSYAKIGKQCEREHQSISQYANNLHEIPSTVWLKLTAKWPELGELMLFELDEAEKAFRAKQRELRLTVPERQERAA